MPSSPLSGADGSSPVRRRTFLRSGASAGIGIVALAGCSEQAGTGNPVTEDATPTQSPTAGTRSRTETTTRTEETEPPEEPEPTDEPQEGTDEGTPADAESWFVRPDGEPQQVPTQWVCDDDQAERQPQLFDEASLSWGDDPAGRWELRVDDIEFEYGAAVHVRLRNVSDEEQATSHHDAYNLQIETEDGWKDVRVWRDGQPKPHPAERVVHDPDEGFDWQFSMTEDEFDDQEIEVCPDLETARYRFAFEYEDGKGIAVGFDLTVS